MKNDSIDAAVAEAERFIVRAKALKARRKKDEWLSEWQGCKESGALRRASLDLSRALTNLRGGAQ